MACVIQMAEEGDSDEEDDDEDSEDDDEDDISDDEDDMSDGEMQAGGCLTSRTHCLVGLLLKAAPIQIVNNVLYTINQIVQSFGAGGKVCYG